MKELYERIYTRFGHKDGKRILGHLNVSKTGQTTGGWLVHTWSEGAPYWTIKMHWLENGNKKLYHPNFKVGIGMNFMDTQVEDTEIEPERAELIRETIKEWENDWLESQFP